MRLDFEICSIASTGSSDSADCPPGKEDFHGLRVYGSVVTHQRAEIEAVWGETHVRIYSERGESDNSCLWPRHGVGAFGEVENGTV